MAERRFFLIAGIVLGACLPGCLRPFGQRESQDYCPAVGQAGPKEGVVTSSGSDDRSIHPIINTRSQPVPELVVMPSHQEENTLGPDKKPTLFQSVIIASPDLSATDNPPGPAPAPVPALPGFMDKRDFLGQLGPATSAPPNLTEQSESPPPGPPIVARSDYPSKEALLDVVHYFLADQPEKVIELLNHYDSAKQNIFMTLLPVLAGLSQKPAEPLSSKEVKVIQDQIEGLLESLRPRSELAITKMCFCKSIKAFAMYDPWPEDHVFRASSKGGVLDGDVVQVYVELSNFCCERRENYHEIHLSSTVEIRPKGDSKNAKPVWFKRFDDSKQPPVRSWAQLHDYFCRYYFAVPHLPSGEYTMIIRVVDETFPDKQRRDEKSLKIRVIAPETGS